MVYGTQERYTNRANYLCSRNAFARSLQRRKNNLKEQYLKFYIPNFVKLEICKNENEWPIELPISYGYIIALKK